MRNMSYKQDDIADYLNSADQYIKDIKVLIRIKLENHHYSNQF